MKTLLLILISIYAYAGSFSEKYNRYPAPYAMFVQMKRLVPKFEVTGLAIDQCKYLGRENSGVLGSNLPSFGLPLEPEPGALFAPLFAKCFGDVLEAGLVRINSEAVVENAKTIFGPTLFSELMADLALRHETNFTITNFASISPALRDKIMRRLIFYIVGPVAILKYFKYIGPNNVFGRPINTAGELANFLETAILPASGTQFTLLHLIQDMTTILRLGPAMVN